MNNYVRQLVNLDSSLLTNSCIKRLFFQKIVPLEEIVEEMPLKHIAKIFAKEITIEFRQQFAIGGILLFVATVIYLIYKSFNTIDPREWTVLIWIVVVFSGLNAVVKSFLQEKKETYLYYYTIFHPIDLALAKLLYNFVFLMIIFLVSTFFLSIFAPSPIKDYPLFFGSAALGIMGISIVFTFVSLLSASDGNSSTLMSILAIPLILPILLIMLKASVVSARLLTDTAIDQDLWIVVGIDSMFLGLLLILFPMLWRS
jgi:heme exporter protein B